MQRTENAADAGFYYDNSRDVGAVGTRRHAHDNYEIYFLERGECTYFADHRYFPLTAGDLILIPSGEAHRAFYKRETHSRRLINCEKKYIPTEVLAALSDVDHVFRAPRLLHEIVEIFDLIAEEYAGTGAYRTEMLTTHVHRLFYLIARHREENVAPEHESTAVKRALDYIKENYTREITLELLSRACGVTPAHLSRAIKRETGVGFNEYLNALRLQRAEFMLRNENGKSVSDIAFACGFNDSNYFSYRFKRAYGVSPTHIKNKK